MRSLKIHLAGRAPDVERWSRGELESEVIKENRGRKIWRVPAGQPALFVKRFPPSLFRDRARKEAAMLGALEEAGVPCPRLVATGRDESGSYLITEEIPDVRPLMEVIERGGPEVRGLLVALGELVRRLQDAGFEHQDLHVGNILLGGDRLFVTDVHRARKVARMGAARRIRGLAFTAMSFVDLRPRSDIARFLRAAGCRTHEEWEKVWTELLRCLHRYYSGREKRCVAGGRGFGMKGKVYYREGIDLDRVLAWAASDRKTAVKVEGSRGLYRSEDGLFLKKVRPGRAVRYWRNAHGLTVRRIGTPCLHACGGTWVVGDWVEAPDLYACVRDRFGRLDRRGRNDFLSRLASIFRRMHERGVYHEDLKATNILVSNGGFLFVDLDRVRFSLHVPEERRIFNLAQLNASLTPPLTRTDRLRFLDFYFGPCASLRRRKEHWVREIMRITHARAHRWPAGSAGT